MPHATSATVFLEKGLPEFEKFEGISQIVSAHWKMLD